MVGVGEERGRRWKWEGKPEERGGKGRGGNGKVVGGGHKGGEGAVERGWSLQEVGRLRGQQ